MKGKLSTDIKRGFSKSYNPRCGFQTHTDFCAVQFYIFNPHNSFRSVLTQKKYRKISEQCIVFSKGTKLCRCFKILKIHIVFYFLIFYSYSFRDI